MASRSRVTLEVCDGVIEGDVVLSRSRRNPVLTTEDGQTDYLCGNCGDVVLSGEPGAPLVMPTTGRLLFACAKCRTHNVFPL